jgi:hypothetical protein
MRPSIVLVCAALALAACSGRMPATQEVGQSAAPPSSDSGTAGTVCTMDAKQCPDGSWVGRVPPSCEFAPCP